MPIVDGVDADHVDEVSPPLPPDFGRVERSYLDWITNMSHVVSPPLPPDFGRVERAYLDWMTNMSRAVSVYQGFRQAAGQHNCDSGSLLSCLTEWQEGWYEC